MESIFSLFVILTVLTVVGCDEDISNPKVSEDEVIGEWVLTKITVVYPFGPQVHTPQEENSEVTIILNSDKTCQRYQNIKGEVTNDSGTWSVADGGITIISGSETFNFPCRVNGNILQITTTRHDPDNGNILPITLEFTKK